MNLRGEHPKKTVETPQERSLEAQNRDIERGRVAMSLYKTKVTTVQGFAPSAFLQNGNHQTTEIRLLRAGYAGSVAAVWLLLLGQDRSAKPTDNVECVRHSFVRHAMT